MRLHEFAAALPLLPVDLRERAKALHPYAALNPCTSCREVNDALDLAMIAARYDEFPAAAAQLTLAEALAAKHRSTTSTGCRDRRSPGRGRGQVVHWRQAPGDLIAATDASWKAGHSGIAYVISDGRFGLIGRTTDRMDPTGPSRVLINELRAVEYLLAGLSTPPQRLTVLIDSMPALDYLRRWRAGEVTAMPAGYSLRPRINAAKPTLVRLAEVVAQLSNVAFQHVTAHAGHPLNEAADSLSSMARRRLTEPFDLHRRAADLVDAFLRDWHTATRPTAQAA